MLQYLKFTAFQPVRHSLTFLFHFDIQTHMASGNRDTSKCNMSITFVQSTSVQREI